jgi:hypothetical protein
LIKAKLLKIAGKSVSSQAVEINSVEELQLLGLKALRTYKESMTSIAK